MNPKFKRVLITSIPGADWDETKNETFIDSFKERISRECNIRVKTFSIRELIYDYAHQENVLLVPNRIQRSSDEDVRLLRRLAFLHLEKHLVGKEENGDEVTVIQTRATSYSGWGKEESLSGRYLEEINPDLFIVIIDDPIAIYNRIPKREETKKYGYLEIIDIVRWMENEVAHMEELARELNRRLFVIPRRQVGALVDLLMTDKKPAYASYAMSQASEEGKESIKVLVEKLKRHFVVFDPACMGTAHTEIKMTDQEHDFYRDNVKKRDEQWFIKINSEYTIVYLPESVPAHGSQRELDTASEKGKTVWVVLEPGYSDEIFRLTPFIEQPSDIVFVSSKEFEYFLDLSLEEQAVYACITKTMRGFKRRGGLRPLINRNGDDSSIHIGPEEISREFIQEARDTYNQQVTRGMIPSVEDKRLLEMARESWEVNRPVWESKAHKADVLPLFAQRGVLVQEDMTIAARNDSAQISRESQPQVTMRAAETAKKISLSDKEVFAAIFEKYATGNNREEWFGKLRDFFEQKDLGTFAEQIEFLRFLKATLDRHRYRSPSVFSSQNLAAWVSEYDQGKSEGKKQ